MKYLVLFSACTAVGLLASCGKKDPEPKTYSELLMAKTWQLTDETEQLGTAAPVSLFSAYAGCKKDNTMKFTTKKAVVLDEGAMRCTPADAQNQSGIWSVSSKYLTYSILGHDGGTWEIDELADTKLVVSAVATTNGVKVVVRRTYTAI